MSMNKHSQSTKSNKFAISLQYLKKESKVCSSFFALRQIQSFFKLELSFLMEITRRVQSSQIGYR